MGATHDVVWMALLVLAACSAKAIVDDGAGAGSTSTTTTTTTTTGTTTSTIACGQHGDCPSGVCVFAAGVCSVACSQLEPCPQGQVCDICATSSCPSCKDCMAACVPAAPGSCDDHDDCAPSEVCIYYEQRCALTCVDGCPDPNTYCDPCATYPCPACAQCVAACVMTF